MPNVKKYLITAITLGAIAMASGALIGVTNLITAERIKQNEASKINEGVKEVFNLPNGFVSDKGEAEGFTYVKHCYSIQESENSPTYAGIAFLTSGSNMYGKVSLIVGFTLAEELSGVYFVTNEQTYASTLVENYVDPLNAGTRDVEDVKCGATYGATLVKDMINEAKQAITNFISTNA